METIQRLYHIYRDELVELKKAQIINKLYFTSIAFDDIESELLYMYIRETKPLNVVEFSPFYGWSTFNILHALNKNEKGLCVSYDLVDFAVNSLEKTDLCLQRWKFVKSDVTEFFDKWNYDQIDFMFIDCDHSTEFAEKYCAKVLPKMMTTSKTVFIHDIYHDWKCGEQDVVKSFIAENKIPYVSPSKHFREQREIINTLRETVYGDDIVYPIHYADMNPVVILNPHIYFDGYFEGFIEKTRNIGE